MTRRDYIALAGYLRDLKPTTGGFVLNQWGAMVNHLAAEFGKADPRFDRERWYEACNRGDDYDELRKVVANYHRGDDGE